MLANFKGYLQCNGYVAYKEFKHEEGVTFVGCMAHARRYFEKALDLLLSKAEHAMLEIQKTLQNRTKR